LSGCVPPQLPFNPAIACEPLQVWELYAGPLGLIAFVVLVPLVRLAARARRRTALIVGALVWVVGTAGPKSTVMLLLFLALACTWVRLLDGLRRRGWINPAAMIGLVWLGLHLLILPLWWFPALQPWYGWRLTHPPALHAFGFAYLMLRVVAWGVDTARRPPEARRSIDTACWLLYPPCMRNGPILLRDAFLKRLDAWDPRAKVPVGAVLKRLVSALVGLVALAVAARWTPSVALGAVDFFAAPQGYSTGELLRVFYLLPIQIYLFLWSYSELAIGLALWLGIKVDENFNWAPGATSVRDFWRRWHVTVGLWLRNYVYIPLGGNRGIIPLHYLVVFGYCGLWHGAALSFLAWGLSQAAALTVQLGWDRLRDRLGWQNRPSGHVWTAFCWLLTLHYQVATLVVFADFQHVGTRFFAELFGRLAG
jgi:D-alanyl-lipoteichoic acid acyltransferase DltB (MBOAT superfamily)